MTFPRVRAMIFVAVLFVTAGVVVLTAINRDTQNAPLADPCAPGEIRVNVSVPEQEEVTLNVYNGTVRVGLADQIAGEFANRGFIANKMDATPEGGPFPLAGHLVYGPQAVGAAWLVSAYFLDGEYAGTFIPDREGPEVDVILGDGFQQLATTTEVNQAIAANGEPRPPAGTCADPSPAPLISPTPSIDPSASPDPSAATASPSA
jgi:hypothetical protein